MLALEASTESTDCPWPSFPGCLCCRQVQVVKKEEHSGIVNRFYCSLGSCMCARVCRHMYSPFHVESVFWCFQSLAQPACKQERNGPAKEESASECPKSARLKPRQFLTCVLDPCEWLHFCRKVLILSIQVEDLVPWRLLTFLVDSSSGFNTMKPRGMWRRARKLAGNRKNMIFCQLCHFPLPGWENH